MKKSCAKWFFAKILELFHLRNLFYWHDRSVLEVQRDNFRPPIIFPDTFGQMASHILRSRKSQKIAKKSILAKNSNFDRVADIGRNDDIWPEMGPWGVLELFCTKNRYLNPSRSHFKKSRKIDFFELFNRGVTPKIQS